MKKSKVFNDLLEKVRQIEHGASDYKLAQMLDISTQNISAYRKGDRKPDAYACARVAMAAGADPLEVLAAVESELGKDEKRREFWKSFRSGSRQIAAAVVLSLTLGFSGLGLWHGGADKAVFASGLTSHNVYSTIRAGCSLGEYPEE